jgi:hypothetical protein
MTRQGHNRHNDGSSEDKCARNSLYMRGSFYRGRGYDTNVPHGIEIKRPICESRKTNVSIKKVIFDLKICLTLSRVAEYYEYS